MWEEEMRSFEETIRLENCAANSPPVPLFLVGHGKKKKKDGAVSLPSCNLRSVGRGGDDHRPEDACRAPKHVGGSARIGRGSEQKRPTSGGGGRE